MRDKPIAKVNLKGSEGYAQAMQAREHQLSADEPVSNGGTDTGPAPYELVLAGLAACTAITLRMYAERKGWELGEISLALRFFKHRDEERIERDVHLGGDLDNAQRERLLDICERTPVTLTLKRGTPIVTQLMPTPGVT